jgi:serine/threonine protein kinase
MRVLGQGGVGTVFVVCRAEDRNRRNPTLFAMKIPEYGAEMAHTLSEAEFFDLFRQEAGALLSIPRHPNLARFVTFDAGARPRPILVMELVQGPTLGRLIGTKVLEMSQAFSVLDGIAAGLEAMHDLGVGHLDIKPGNVILRLPEEKPDPLELPYSQRLGSMFTSMSTSVNEPMAVLVDFGLAGRRIRPGCATAEYGAPEIWGYVFENQEPSPMAADVYAFSCLAFETLTGETLIQGKSNMAVITNHTKHDGAPDGFSRLKGSADSMALAGVLREGLRRNFADRCTIAEMRQRLAEVGGRLLGRSWPIR